MSDALFQPRPVRRDTDLGRLLQQLEVPENPLHPEEPCCPYERPRLLDEQDARDPRPDWADEPRERNSCHLPPEYCFVLLVRGQFGQPLSMPCKHCLAADHRCTLEDWALLLADHDPLEACPPPLPEPRVMLTHAERVAEYAMRAERGRHLYHPEDVLSASGVDVEAAGKSHTRHRLSKIQGRGRRGGSVA